MTIETIYQEIERKKCQCPSTEDHISAQIMPNDFGVRPNGNNNRHNNYQCPNLLNSSTNDMGFNPNNLNYNMKETQNRNSNSIFYSHNFSLPFCPTVPAHIQPFDPNNNMINFQPIIPTTNNLSPQGFLPKMQQQQQQNPQKQNQQLISEEQQQMQKSRNEDQQQQQFPSPSYEIRNIFMNKSDLALLSKRAWLNDIVVNSYLDWLHNTYDRPDIGVTNSFFYNKLTRAGSEDAEIWGGIKGYKLNSFLHFLIPMAVKSHWFLFHIDFVENVFKVYESLNKVHPEEIMNIKAFLTYQGIDDMEVVYPNVPKQTNGYDCGPFMLMFARLIFLNLPINHKNVKPGAMMKFRKEISENLKKYVKKRK